MRIRLALAVVATIAALPAAPVRASETVYVTAVAFTYAPGDLDWPQAPLRITEGDTLVFVNLDPLGFHNVTSVDLDEDGNPIFQSAVVGATESGEVRDLRAQAPGRYGFYCEPHNPLMQGEVEILKRDD